MATSRSDMTNSTSLDGLLKNIYLPTLVDTIYNDHRFADMIQARSDIVMGGGNQIVHFAQTQRSEGVGNISEGGSWVNDVPVKGKQLTENVVYHNSYIELNNPLIASANRGEQSAVDAVTAHFNTNITAFKNNFDRQLTGSGGGQCAYVSSISGNSLTVTKTNYALAPYNADQFLPTGSRVNIATFDSNGVAASGFCNSNAADSYVFIISGVSSRSLSAGTATLTITDADGTAYAAAGTTDIAANDYVVRENAYGTPGTAAVTFPNCLEMNGLSNLVSDGASNSETTSNYTTTWGLTRTSFDYLQSFMNDFSAELDEDNLTSFIMDLEYSVQARPNLLVVTPKAERKYFLNMKEDRRFQGVTKRFEGGYAEMYIQLGDLNLRLTSLGQVPSGVLFAINTDDFAFAQTAPFSWVLGDGGSVLVQSHTSDVKFASATQYNQFICFDLARQGKGFSITE